MNRDPIVYVVTATGPNGNVAVTTKTGIMAAIAYAVSQEGVVVVTDPKGNEVYRGNIVKHPAQRCGVCGKLACEHET